MNLDSSANTINIQSSIKVQECEDIIFQDATRTHKKWSDLPTSQHTTSVGEGIVQGIMSRINHYVAKLVWDRRRHQYFKYVMQRQELKTWLWKSYQVPSLTWVMIQKRRRMTAWVMMLSFNQYQSFHVIGVLLLIKPEPCYVPASILKGLVCHVFIWLVLRHYVMTRLCLILIPQNFPDLHTMTLWSVGGTATCIMPTDLQHHCTFLRNITF